MNFFDPIMPTDNVAKFHACKRIYDAAFSDLVKSLGIPASLLATSVDCGSYRPSTNKELFQKRIDKITQEMSDKVIRDMIAKPEGQLGWNDICATTMSSPKTSDFSLDRLKETMKELRHTITGNPLSTLELRSCPFMGSRKQLAMSIQELVNVCKEVVAHQCSYPQE